MWKRLVAEIRLDKFEVNISENEIFESLKKINSKKIRIVDFVKPCLVVFETKTTDYMFIGKQLEKWLFDNFKLKG